MVRATNLLRFRRVCATSSSFKFPGSPHLLALLSCYSPGAEYGFFIPTEELYDDSFHHHFMPQSYQPPHQWRVPPSLALPSHEGSFITLLERGGIFVASEKHDQLSIHIATLELHADMTPSILVASSGESCVEVSSLLYSNRHPKSTTRKSRVRLQARA